MEQPEVQERSETDERQHRTVQGDGQIGLASFAALKNGSFAMHNSTILGDDSFALPAGNSDMQLSAPAGALDLWFLSDEIVA